MPTISVIVPVYNVEKYIYRCIDSILAQTFTDFELILVDDGSTDNGGAICDEYAAKDSRVKVIHKKNGGVSSARNVGMNAASGDYILFCDSDDYVSRFWAEELLKAAEEFPEALVACGVKRFSNDDAVSLDNWEAPSFCREVTYYDLYKLGISAFSCNKIYARSKIQRLYLQFDETVYLSEDVKFNVTYCVACDRVIVIERELYFYRQIDDSTTGRYHPDLLTLHFLPFQCRLPLIGEERLKEYCSTWLYFFSNLLDNVFDPRNTEMSFLEKICYNQRALTSDAFQYCLEHADTSKENALFVKLMKKKNYLLLWLAQRVAKLKRRLVE